VTSASTNFEFGSDCCERMCGLGLTKDLPFITGPLWFVHSVWLVEIEKAWD